jgi:hypothetical protein
MPTTVFDKLGQITLTANQQVLTFSSIPSGYRELIIIGRSVWVYPGSGNERFAYYFNGDTAANYRSVWTYGDNNSLAENTRIGNANNYGGSITDSNNQGGIVISHIMNYSSTSLATGWQTRTIDGNVAYNMAGYWTNTAAVNQIDLSCAGGSQFKSGSNFSLYGI